MGWIILKSESTDNLELLLKLETKLGIEASDLAQDSFEDISLANAMSKGKTGKFIDAEKLLKDLRK